MLRRTPHVRLCALGRLSAVSLSQYASNMDNDKKKKWTHDNLHSPGAKTQVRC